MKTKMLFCALFIISTCLFSTIINVPVDIPTIQAGIDAAVDADTVLVQPGTYVENINYNGKNITVASLFLTTQDTTYISATIIDGNQNGSVVTFESGEDSTAVMTGFTITNGSGRFFGSPGGCSVQGGGIYCVGSSPSLSYLIVTNNNVAYLTYATYARGGGICVYGDYMNPSDLNLTNTKIINNSAFEGGGIFLENCQNAFISDVLIENNISQQGGGLYSDFSNLYLSGVRITDNFSELTGAGLKFIGYPGQINLEFSLENRCDIFNNNLGNNRGYGSDIHISDCDPIEVILDTFTVLTPTDYYASPIENLTFDILHGIYDLINANLFVSPDGNNTNSGLNESEPLLNISVALSRIYSDSLNQNSIYLLPGIYSPSTSGEQFPIHLSSYISLDGENENQTILDAEETSIVIEMEHVNGILIKDLTVENGFGKGGGIRVKSSNISLRNLIISDNNSIGYGMFSPTSFGGGISSTNSTLFLNNIEVEDNSGFAGGIYCSNSQVILNNSIIDNNSASGYNGGAGGGFFIADCSNVQINNTVISSNHSYGGMMGAGGGAGLYIEDSEMNLFNVEISNNTTPYGFGGGINCSNSNSLFENVIIINNHADTGGGLYLHQSSPILSNLLILNNSADYNGGGIKCIESDPFLNNVTIYNNYPIGIYCLQYSNPILMNCILWNNFPEEIYFWENSDPNSISISYSNIQDGEAGIQINNNGTINWFEGNINADPCFNGTGDHPFMLQDLSPCVNAGIQDTTGLNLPEFDLAGNPRIYGDRIDMGAYENQNVVLGADESLIPKICKLYQNYPNPFNPSTTISFSITENTEKMELVIYNLKGQKIKDLTPSLCHAEPVEVGGEKRHSVTWNGKDENNKPVSSGIYFYKLKTDNFDKTRKMIFMK